MSRNILTFVLAAIVCIFSACNANSSTSEKQLAESASDESAEETTLEGDEADIKIANEIFDYFKNEQFEKIVPHFDANLKSALTADQLKTIWATLNTQAGKLEKKGEVSAKAMSGFNVVFVECAFTNAKVYLKLAFNDKHEVIGLFFVPTKA